MLWYILTPVIFLVILEIFYIINLRHKKSISDSDMKDDKCVAFQWFRNGMVKCL